MGLILQAFLIGIRRPKETTPGNDLMEPTILNPKNTSQVQLADPSPPIATKVSIIGLGFPVLTTGTIRD